MPSRPGQRHVSNVDTPYGALIFITAEIKDFQKWYRFRPEATSVSTAWVKQLLGVLEEAALRGQNKFYERGDTSTVEHTLRGEDVLHIVESQE